MNVPRRIGLYTISAFSASMVACSDNATSPAIQLVQPSRSISAATLTGRIVYTTGALRIYNVATKADVSLGVSGVNPKFSPDGTLITYQGGGGVSVMNSDGTNNRLLVANGATPSFNPAGTVIAYGNGGIWKINIDGTGKTQLTTAGIQPSWSPDGTQISYDAGVSGGGQQLFLMNSDGTNAHRALTSAAIIDPVWQPSNRILFGLMTANGRQSDYELNSYDPATGTPTRLTTNKGNDDEPSWSPDATGISWTSGLGGIWIMNADGSGAQVALASSKARQGSWGR